jgi:hypothetical protein
MAKEGKIEIGKSNRVNSKPHGHRPQQTRNRFVSKGHNSEPCREGLAEPCSSISEPSIRHLTPADGWGISPIPGGLPRYSASLSSFTHEV